MVRGRIKNKIDILHILRKLKGVEQLKKILFDENQNKLLKYLESSSDFDVRASIMRFSKNENDKISLEETNKIVEEIAKKQKQTKIDKKLISAFENKIVC